MKARITTRAGRKIRHVAPGYVVDVATGIELMRFDEGRHGTRWHLRCGDASRTSINDLLARIAAAEGACALVRGMLTIGGWS